MKSIASLCVMTVLGVFLCSLPARAGELTLAVAASLKEVVNDLTAEYARKNPGVAFRINYGGSGVLAKQIEQGAPADLFIAANREWVDYLRERKLVEPVTIGTFAYNALVFAGTTKQPVVGMKDLAKLQKIAIGSPKSVPAGEYAVKSFKVAGIEKELAGRLVMAKDVREAMKYAELGEVDGAFVYRTDAMLLGKQAKILFSVPEGLHDRVTYPMALTVAGATKPEARAFLRFLGGREARKALEKYGFEVR